MQVVLYPGLLCDASIWAAQVEALRPYADVAVADFSQPASLEGMARSALALRDGKLVVIGHSMGARAALEMVRLAPDRIERLALLDTGTHPRREGEKPPVRFSWISLIGRAWRPLPTDGFRPWWTKPEPAILR